MFNLYNFIFQRLIWKMISVYLLWFDYWTLRNEKLQKYRIILLQHTSCLHKWLVLSLICLLLLFFSGKFLNVCKPRTTLYPLWQPGPTGLTFYGSELTCLQAGWDGDCRLVLFHVIKNFLANEICHFSWLSHQTGCPFTWAACSI